MALDAWKSPAFASARSAAASLSGEQRTYFMGVMWVTVAMALFAGLAAFARALMLQGIHPFEVVFLRNIFALMAMAPLLITRGASLLHTANLSLYWVRAAISIVSMLAWFTALSLIPLGEVTAISFLSPLFGTLTAGLFLGEVVRVRRWTALLIGFAGALIILRPTAGSIGLGQGLAIVSALSGGVLAVLIKQLTSRDEPSTIVFLTNAMLTPLSLLPALYVWVWPTADSIPLLIGLGATAVLGHVALTRGFAAMDASLVMTFDFSRLPFTVALAYLAFGETIDGWTWLGATIIFASAVYITRREAQLRRAT
jgi:drug/metabolite transporter (DMT)-like permease